jgi:hypothetical protein
MTATTTTTTGTDPTIRVNSALIARAAADQHFHDRIARNLEETGRPELLPGFFAAVRAVQAAPRQAGGVR